MSHEMVTIDGSLLEGGGQIIRNAISLSVLTRRSIKIINIRAGRNKPGLMEQHLKGIELAREISKANLQGGEFGSTEIKFSPEKIYGGKYNSFVRTAGSIGLLLQVSLPCLIFADSKTELHMKGGTNAEMAPQIDYLTEVFRPILEKFGGSFDLDLIKRGYFPKGGGEVYINVNPVKELVPVELVDQGMIKSIYGWSFVAGSLHINIANEMARAASDVLGNLARVDLETYKESPDVAPTGNCSGIIIVAETSTGCILGASALGKRGETGDATGRRAANELLDVINHGACVDNYSQDQIIIFMALAKGKSKVKVKELTMHTKTAIYIAELLTNAKFNIISSDQNSIIECVGIGLTSQ